MKRQRLRVPVIGIVLFCMQTAFAWKLENTSFITYDKDDKTPSIRTRELDFSDPLMNHAENTAPKIQESQKRSDSQPDQRKFAIINQEFSGRLCINQFQA